MNKVILTGNIVKPIEIRYTTNNIPAIQNTIAVRNEYKNARGEYESQFINFTAYRNNAEFLSKYTNKGSKVLLEGKVNNRSYDRQDGTKAYITEVIVDRVELIGTKPKEEQPVEQPKPEVDPFTQMGIDIDNFLDD